MGGWTCPALGWGLELAKVCLSGNDWLYSRLLLKDFLLQLSERFDTDSGCDLLRLFA